MDSEKRVKPWIEVPIYRLQETQFISLSEMEQQDDEEDNKSSWFSLVW